MSTDWIKLLVWGLVVFLAQISLAPLIEVRNASPDLLLIFVLTLTIRRGRYAGLAAGFLVGIFQDAVSIGSLGIMALATSSVAFWAGVWHDRRDSQLTAAGWLVLAALAALMQGFIVGIFSLQGSSLRLEVFMLYDVLPSSLYTAVLALLLALAPTGAFRQPLKGAALKTKRVVR